MATCISGPDRRTCEHKQRACIILNDDLPSFSSVVFGVARAGGGAFACFLGSHPGAFKLFLSPFRREFSIKKVLMPGVWPERGGVGGMGTAGYSCVTQYQSRVMFLDFHCMARVCAHITRNSPPVLESSFIY